jgi:hypothetical protein
MPNRMISVSTMAKHLQCTARTVPRQAIISIYQPPLRWPDVSLALAIDLLAVMVSVNGFNLAIAGVPAPDADLIVSVVPAGVDLHLTSAENEAPSAAGLMRAYAERGFERIVLIAADTIGVSTRLLATASSMLASEPIVIGVTHEANVYCVAVRGDETILSNRATEAFSTLERGSQWHGERNQFLEPKARLREIVDLVHARNAIADAGPVVPRAARAVARDA